MVDGSETPAGGPAREDGGRRLVGRRRRRGDAPERLTGRTRFAGDVALPGMLHARLVPSPHAAARVVSVDRSAALAVPGVAAVLTAADLRVPDVAGAVEERRILLALERVVHAGQPVAVVLAESEAAAEDGAAAVEVTYEPLRVAIDPLAAASPDAPVVRERRRRDEAELGMHGAAAEQSSEVSDPSAPNVVGEMRLVRGDAARALAEAHLVVEREYRTSWVHQGHVEPQSCLATLDGMDNLVVYASTQALFHVRNEVARTLGLPTRRVVVQPMPVGGGFGAKFGLVEPLVAALAYTLRRPVRLVFTRSDEFAVGNPASQVWVRLQLGAAADGRLTALQAELLLDAGANAGAPLSLVGLLLGSCYRFKHLLIEGREVLTNRPGVGAYRAPGATQASFAMESAVDEVARKLDLDPLELRRLNAVQEGDLRADGAEWPRIGFRECLDRAEPIYRAERAAARPGEGVGLAAGAWFGGTQPAAAACRLEPDGTLHFLLGAVDLTGTYTTFQTIAAEAFGLEDPEQVHVVAGGTDAAPLSGASGGSKITYTVGAAVLRAAADAREQVLRIAAAELEVSPDDLEIAGGAVRVRGLPDRRMTLAQIGRLGTAYRGKYEPVFGRGQSAIEQGSPAFGVHVVRVRVDPETGWVEPVRYVVVQDVGCAINPATIEGQLFGGALQGVGWALLERMAVDDGGALLTGSFLDYALPTVRVLPELRAELVEVPSELGPFGAKGVGEPPVIPGAAAFANAVFDACGARVAELPITPERVYRAARAPAG